MKKMQTKKALISSVLSLVVCLAMLIGTTFAWFTDSAASKGNIIKSGNLNIDLLVKENGKYVSVKENKNPIFNYELWEPGYTAVKNVKVETTGNLALKYTMTIVPKTAAAEALKLAEVIDVYYAADEVTVADRNLTGLTKLGTLADVFNGKVAAINDTLIPDKGNTFDCATIALKMQETAGNEYQNLPVGGGGGFDINVLATQYTYESDDFDTQYDKDALQPEIWDGTTADVKDVEKDSNGTYQVNTPAEFAAVLDVVNENGNVSLSLPSGTEFNMNNNVWEPIYVDGQKGAGVITVEGNGSTITGLTAPLFDGGFAGNTGIVIKNLTIADSDFVDTSAGGAGFGAFVSSVDSMPNITLINCKLVNSTITSTTGSRVGGLIGWTAGYDVQDDGPVDTYITVTNCEVSNCTITAEGSVGAIIGHAGANPATYHTISDCVVKDNTLTSTDDGGWRVGVVVGTAQVGEVTISNITESGNTLAQTGKTAPEGQSNLYGRKTTGKLEIDGVEIK